MYDGIGKAFEGLMKGVAILIILSTCMFPLAVWKIIDIIVWIYNHISIS
jgi:hypothetical protein